jgi:membrane associated rhomboid family serine protease
MKNRFFALWLALVCVVMFAMQNYISGFTDFLILNSTALSGQIWRFVSALFLHGSLSHITYNMFALIIFGLILESLIGSKKFLLVFFLSGILANIIGVFFYDSSLGASGAIFGVIGALTLRKPLMTVWAFGLPMPMFIASALWAAGDLLGMFFPSNVGHIAHLSGLGVGLLLGIYFRITQKQKGNNKISYTVKIPESHMRRWERKHFKS